MFNSLKMLATNSFLLHFISVRTASSTHWLLFFTFDRISPYPSMLHKYASESKWEDAIRLCRFVKVKKILFLWCSQCLYTVLKVWYFLSLEKLRKLLSNIYAAASHYFYKPLSVSSWEQWISQTQLLLFVALHCVISCNGEFGLIE